MKLSTLAAPLFFLPTSHCRSLPNDKPARTTYPLKRSMTAQLTLHVVRAVALIHTKLSHQVATAL